MMQLSIFPPSNKTNTSQAAARNVAGKCEQARRDILAWLAERGDYGATDQEMQAHFGWSPDFQRPRRWELYRLYMIRLSGEKRTLADTGNKARVWVRA